jgi:hypothetical protein
MSGAGFTDAGAEDGADDVVGASDEVLAAAVRDRTPVARLTEAHPDLSLEDAYRIQAAGCARRVAAGERVIGAITTRFGKLNPLNLKGRNSTSVDICTP